MARRQISRLSLEATKPTRHEPADGEARVGDSPRAVEGDFACLADARHATRAETSRGVETTPRVRGNQARARASSSRLPRNCRECDDFGRIATTVSNGLFREKANVPSRALVMLRPPAARTAQRCARRPPPRRIARRRACPSRARARVRAARRSPRVAPAPRAETSGALSPTCPRARSPRTPWKTPRWARARAAAGSPPPRTTPRRPSCPTEAGAPSRALWETSRPPPGPSDSIQQPPVGPRREGGRRRVRPSRVPTATEQRRRARQGRR